MDVNIIKILLTLMELELHIHLINLRKTRRVDFTIYLILISDLTSIHLRSAVDVVEVL